MYFTDLNVDINEVNISKIVISSKISFGKKGFKRFIGSKMTIKLSIVHNASKNDWLCYIF